MSGSTLPTIMQASGLQPQTPAALSSAIVAEAVGLAPGLTTELPGSIISDIVGTDTGAALVIDAARVDLVNSLTPLGANPFLLYQQGQMVGVAQGQDTNGNCNVVFTASGATAGVIIQPGFIVSDGTNQYTIPDGGVTDSAGQTQPLLAIATNNGIFPIPAGSVTQFVSSSPAPPGVTLAVTNPFAGNPAVAQQTISDYRSQVLQAWNVASVGTPQFLRTLLGNVPGVNTNLISIRVVSGVGWEIIVGGGGDQYLIAYAILQAVGDIAYLVGSTLQVNGVTAATNGVVTTNLNHGFSTGQAVTIAGVTPSGYNGTYSSITVLTEKTFELNTNTSSFGAYVSGGVITPNFRNVAVSLNYYPDTYVIPFVVPPAQTVSMLVQWNTISPNFVSATNVASLASAALAAYVNALPIGQPLNVDVMISVFQTAVASILAAPLISALNFTVDINGISTAPTSGTVLIQGDPESYFTATASSIVVSQL
jgi:hypothetical protein